MVSGWTLAVLSPEMSFRVCAAGDWVRYFSTLNCSGTNQGDNTTGPVPSQMGKASITTITTTKMTTRTAIFAGLDLMDASLQARSIRERS